MTHLDAAALVPSEELEILRLYISMVASEDDPTYLEGLELVYEKAFALLTTFDIGALLDLLDRYAALERAVDAVRVAQYAYPGLHEAEWGELHNELAALRAAKHVD